MQYPKKRGRVHYLVLGLFPKLWTHLKIATMRKEVCDTEAVTSYLTIQRKSPAAATMRLSGVTLVSMIYLRLSLPHPIANEANQA